MPQTSTPLERYAYAKFAMKVVAAGNHHWRMHHPGQGDWILDRDGLHSWLFRWGIETGRIEDPGPRRPTSTLSYAARLYAHDPEAVLEAARGYWNFRVAVRLGRERQVGHELEKAGRS